MKPIYMTHEKHGVHIAYSEDEIKRNEANGWVVCGDRPPGEKATEPVVMEVKKRGRPRKAA